MALPRGARIETGSAGAHFNLGVAREPGLRRGGRRGYGNPFASTGPVQREPGSSASRWAPRQAGRGPAAFRKVDARPDDAETRRSTAVTHTLLGNVEEAIDHYKKLLEANEKDLDALNAIAWIRATHADPAHRDATEAVDLAERARDASSEENSVLFDTLAAAYAEAGRFDHAVAACGKAIELARLNGRDQNVSRYEQQLLLFRARTPFRIR
jgi:tetratricopeptide (TPR) repeat protein